MPKNDYIVTVNGQEVQYVECCDCGLVHEVSYDIYENKVDMHFERNEGRTIFARSERNKNKVKKNPCELLDEAISREKLIPISQY